MSDAGPGWRADAILVLITAIWGVTFVTVKDALSHADAMVFLALRFGVGAVAGAILARRGLTDPGTLKRGGILAALLFGGFVLQTEGLRFTTPSRSAFITGLSVVLVPIAALALFRRAPRPSTAVGIVFATGGLYLLTGFGVGAPAEGSPVGDLLTLGCTVAFAFHIALTERFAPQQPPMALVTVQMAGASLLSALTLPVAGARVEWTPGFLVAVVFCGVVASAMAIGVQTWAQARTTAVRAALIFALEPVFAALYSVAIGREHLGPREVAGGALIVLGIGVAETGAVLWTRWRSRVV